MMVDSAGGKDLSPIDALRGVFGYCVSLACYSQIELYDDVSSSWSSGGGTKGALQFSTLTSLPSITPQT
jgi:hypothetical protein